MRAAPVATAPPDAPRMTVEEWAALDEDEPGELVDGQLTEDEAPDVIDETVVMWLARRLGEWGDHHDAEVYGSGVKYGVSEARGRMPDLSVYLEGRRPPRRGLVTDPPDIAVEVVSTAWSDVRRDRVEKVDDYARFGIRWYWIVDPGLRTFEVWELRDGAYAREGAASTGEVAEIPGCPGLVLDLDALWAKVDALP